MGCYKMGCNMVISPARIGMNSVVSLLLAAILWVGVSNSSVADETESAAEARTSGYGLASATNSKLIGVRDLFKIGLIGL